MPKQSITNLISESVSSSSIHLIWDDLLSNTNKSITNSIAGYKIHYIPLNHISTEEPINNLDFFEDIFTTDKNEHTLTDLRKFTDYQVCKFKIFFIVYC